MSNAESKTGKRQPSYLVRKRSNNAQFKFSQAMALASERPGLEFQLSNISVHSVSLSIRWRAGEKCVERII